MVPLRSTSGKSFQLVRFWYQALRPRLSRNFKGSLVKSSNGVDGGLERFTSGKFEFQCGKRSKKEGIDVLDYLENALKFRYNDWIIKNDRRTT
jgi:hypothetical protein